MLEMRGGKMILIGGWGCLGVSRVVIIVKTDRGMKHVYSFDKTNVKTFPIVMERDYNVSGNCL